MTNFIDFKDVVEDNKPEDWMPLIGSMNPYTMWKELYEGNFETLDINYLKNKYPPIGTKIQNLCEEIDAVKVDLLKNRKEKKVGLIRIPNFTHDGFVVSADEIIGKWK